MSTLKVSAITDTAGGNTVTINGATPTQYNTMGRNRIINGDMRVAQRGTSAVTGNGDYPVDRFFLSYSNDGAFSTQQDSSAPAGFVNSLKFTTTTADASLGATQFAIVNQWVEGTNLSDLAWGTANAKTVTLSFWVRSSLTGTFAGSLRNGDGSRSYPFTYSISAADTWEQKSVTIAGDTTGTWLTTTGRGIGVTFGLGVGSDYSGTGGAWTGSLKVSVPGAVSVVGTLNATWYITGVQLEVGSVATEFERRPYGTELALCQRYYYLHASGADKPIGNACNYNSTEMYCLLHFPTTMRTAPTLSVVSGANYYRFYRNGSADFFDSMSLQVSSTSAYSFYNSGQISGTAGHAGWVETSNASSFLAFTAEL